MEGPTGVWVVGAAGRGSGDLVVLNDLAIDVARGEEPPFGVGCFGASEEHFLAALGGVDLSEIGSMIALRRA